MVQPIFSATKNTLHGQIMGAWLTAAGSASLSEKTGNQASNNVNLLHVLSRHCYYKNYSVAQQHITQHVITILLQEKPAKLSLGPYLYRG